MKCLYCRGEMPDNETHCSRCGADLTEELASMKPKNDEVVTSDVSNEVNTDVQNEIVNNEQNVNDPVVENDSQPVDSSIPNKEKEPKKKGNGILLIILILVIIAVLAVVFVPKFLDKPETSEPNTPVVNDSKDDNTIKEEDKEDNELDGNMSEIFKEIWDQVKNGEDVSDESETTTSFDTTSSTENVDAFLMPIEDIFTITGRGTVVTGRIEKGKIKVNDEVSIIGLDKDIKKVKVIGIEMFRKSLDEAEEGDNVGLLLDGITKDDILRGQVLATIDSIESSKNFKAEITLLTKAEGGRTNFIESGYRPQFYFRTTDVTGIINLPENVSTLSPGEYSIVNVELVSSIAMEEGTTFTIREGGRTVGTGRVLELR